MIVRAEYMWVDGQVPTKKLRSKQKILQGITKKPTKPKDFPVWGFDGSSTFQAQTDKSDCVLMPVYVVPDPIRGNPHVLVLCEVMNEDGKPHRTNMRALLRTAMKKYKAFDPWCGIEQEYTLYDANGVWPYRWPPRGYPKPQGRFYCGVGADEVYGRELVEVHTEACISAGLHICGTNGEVMPAQWEFQLGAYDPLRIADELWIARWLLYRIAEDFEISVKLDPKPIEEGDWNGAGAHINFSTKAMREDKDAWNVILLACEKLKKFHAQHIAVYGADNEKRLTGKHETAPIHQFRWGVSDRGASIRIPLAVAANKHGYIEDRRPAANMDPYVALRALMETVCGDGFYPIDGEADKTLLELVHSSNGKEKEFSPQTTLDKIMLVKS